ncbi:WD40-repeat-containing domain protein [Limtongia smithiae]|uniref:WD40-repeat-containing domain protein n=1 Tax=Limtongia smithiae TaxID=1125753 RepID=UPI0034CF9FCA
MDAANTFSAEILITIFKYLSALDLVQCRGVNRNWNAIAADNLTWSDKLRERWREWPLIRQLPSHLNYMKLYETRFRLDARRKKNKYRRNFLSLSYPVESLCCHGDRIATGSAQYDIISIWDVHTGRLIQALNHKWPQDGILPTTTGSTVRGITCLQFDTELLISGASDGTVIIWSMKSYTPLKYFANGNGPVYEIRMDSRAVAWMYAPNNLKVVGRGALEYPVWYDLAPDDLTSFDIHHPFLVIYHQYGEHELCLLKTGGEIRRWRVQVQTQQRSTATRPQIKRLRFNGDGTKILSAIDSTLYTLDTQTGHCGISKGQCRTCEMEVSDNRFFTREESYLNHDNQHMLTVWDLNVPSSAHKITMNDSDIVKAIGISNCIVAVSSQDRNGGYGLTILSFVYELDATYLRYFADL